MQTLQRVGLTEDSFVAWAHALDQVLWLFGPALSVSCHLDYMGFPEGRTDVSFVLNILHESGRRSCIDASKANHVAVKEWRIYGSAGNYRVEPNDVQFEAIMPGLTPLEVGTTWGMDSPVSWGVFLTGDGGEVVDARPGRYQDFYSQFAAACRREGDVPVRPEQVGHTIEVIDATRESALSGFLVKL